MEREQLMSLDKFEAGRIFYADKIAKSVEKIEEAQEKGQPYEALEALDEKELMELKLEQLNRRERILKTI